MLPEPWAWLVGPHLFSTREPAEHAARTWGEGLEVVGLHPDKLIRALVAENERLRKEQQQSALDHMTSEGQWIEMTGELRAENKRLRELLLEAAVEIESWGAYADTYFRDKHDLSGTVRHFREAAMKEPHHLTTEEQYVLHSALRKSVKEQP